MLILQQLLRTKMVRPGQLMQPSFFLMLQMLKHFLPRASINLNQQQKKETFKYSSLGDELWTLAPLTSHGGTQPRASPTLPPSETKIVKCASTDGLGNSSKSCITTAMPSMRNPSDHAPARSKFSVEELSSSCRTRTPGSDSGGLRHRSSPLLSPSQTTSPVLPPCSPLDTSSPGSPVCDEPPGSPWAVYGMDTGDRYFLWEEDGKVARTEPVPVDYFRERP